MFSAEWAGMRRSILTKRMVAVFGIVLFWAIATIWLIRHEAFPQRFGRAAAGYRVLLEDGPAAVDSWTRIMFKDRTMGYGRFRLETQEQDPSARVLLHYQIVLRLAVFGAPQEVVAWAEAALDDWRQLQRFSLALRAGAHRFRADGHRVGATSFEVRLSGSMGSSLLNLEIPEEAIFYTPLQELLIKRLAPGERLRLRTLDPFSLKPADMFVDAERWEPVVVNGRPTNALALRVTSGGVSLRAWADAEGRIQREESTMGWILERCEADQALAWLGSAPIFEAGLMKDWGGLFDLLQAEAGPGER